MTRLWCVLIIALIASQNANVAPATPTRGPGGLEATDKAPGEPNDPNEILWKKWDVVIKDPNDPNEMLWKKWCAVTKVLQSKTIAQETKERIIDKIVTPIFDFPGMAQLVLGSKKHWPQFTKPQREKFTTLFTKRLKTSYREKISLYTDETGSLKPAQRTNTTVHIPMELVSKDKKMLILYKLRKVGKSWKIYDVEIEGVSILLTYRSQFYDILQRGTVDDILQPGTVENFLKGLEEPPTP